ncbi:Melibiose/raffinose/stachyose import permease protein MelD [Paenibacillus allorhizoplanae]|uniref:Melibiose/raffinose/stachyose import permease protein MelD n=1 Tax=Paenibacillus allorhizoplanae TaxID=2905648 RepID=A0ABN8G1K6_9BACL|nr:sugar ABC transporter permease [Paenibacillus allorhizoplanae]CAH1193067.1 Melibiose/raffinose/stachyose import permease protein MelD [Paenibacillus allorhizoplanae]
MNYNLQKKVTIVTLLFAPVSLLLLFLFYPTIELVRYSFTNWDGFSPTFKYIGLDNYSRVLFDFPEAWHALKNNALYFIIHTCMIPVELVAAVLLNRKLLGSSFFRFTVLMPYIINGIAVAYMFTYIYNPVNGPLDAVLRAVGLESYITGWISNVNVVNYSLVAVSVWRFSGVHIILFMSGLQSIPIDLYESAKLDGANFWQQQRYITLPSIRRVVEIILFLNISGALLQYDIPLVITGGGPGIESSTFGLFALSTAFKNNSYGLASAMAMILLLLVIILSRVQQWLIKDRSEL